MDTYIETANRIITKRTDFSKYTITDKKTNEKILNPEKDMDIFDILNFAFVLDCKKLLINKKRINLNLRWECLEHKLVVDIGIALLSDGKLLSHEDFIFYNNYCTEAVYLSENPGEKFSDEVAYILFDKLREDINEIRFYLGAYDTSLTNEKIKNLLIDIEYEDGKCITMAPLLNELNKNMFTICKFVKNNYGLWEFTMELIPLNENMGSLMGKLIV